MKAALFLIDGRRLRSNDLDEDELDDILTTIKHPDSTWLNLVDATSGVTETVQIRHIVSFRVEV